MPKSLTTNQQNALEAEHLVEVYFFEVAFAAGVQRYCTAGAPIAASSFDPGTLNIAWQGGVDPAWLDTIRETEQSESIGWKINLSGLSSSQISLALGQNYQGTRVSVWYCPCSVTTYALTDTPVKEFEGRVDVMYPEIKDDGQRYLVVEVESKAARFLKPNEQRYTDRDHQRLYPGDTICRFTSQAEKTLVWPAASFFQR